MTVASGYCVGFKVYANTAIVQLMWQKDSLYFSEVLSRKNGKVLSSFDAHHPTSSIM